MFMFSSVFLRKKEQQAAATSENERHGDRGEVQRFLFNALAKGGDSQALERTNRQMSCKRASLRTVSRTEQLID